MDYGNMIKENEFNGHNPVVQKFIIGDGVGFFAYYKLFIDPTTIVFCPDVPDIDVLLFTTDRLINPKNGSNVSSSFILNPSKPTYVVALPDGVIVIPILLIDDLSGAGLLVPAKIKDNGMLLVIVFPKLDGALI